MEGLDMVDYMTYFSFIITLLVKLNIDLPAL